MPYEIPQNLKYVEKIAFGLTFWQLFWIGLFGLLAGIIFLKTPLIFELKVVLALFFMVLGAVLPRFGLSHAKLCRALFSGEVKTAKQLFEETGVSYHKIYSVLKDLEGKGILVCINTSPANYHVPDAVKVFERLLSKRIKELEKLGPKVNDVVGDHDEDVKEYMVRLNVKSLQTKLFDSKNKLVVREFEEASQLAKGINGYVKGLEPKKEYAYAIYR